MRDQLRTRGGGEDSQLNVNSSEQKVKSNIPPLIIRNFPSLFITFLLSHRSPSVLSVGRLMIPKTNTGASINYRQVDQRQIWICISSSSRAEIQLPTGLQINCNNKSRYCNNILILMESIQTFIPILVLSTSTTFNLTIQSTAIISGWIVFSCNRWLNGGGG